MSRFRKLSHAIWHCQSHVFWTPKYRYRILAGQVREEVTNCIHSFSEQLRCEVVELNVQSDHVHLLVMIPPKVRVSPNHRPKHYRFCALIGYLIELFHVHLRGGSESAGPPAMNHTRGLESLALGAISK